MLNCKSNFLVGPVVEPVITGLGSLAGSADEAGGTGWLLSWMSDAAY